MEALTDVNAQMQPHEPEKLHTTLHSKTRSPARFPIPVLAIDAGGSPLLLTLSSTLPLSSQHTVSTGGAGRVPRGHAPRRLTDDCLEIRRDLFPAHTLL